MISVDLDKLKAYIEKSKQATKDLEDALKKYEEVKDEVKTLKESNSKILSYVSMTEDEKTALIKDIDPWEVGKAYKVCDKIKCGSVAYEVIQAHTSQGDWRPESVPALYKVYVPKETASGDEVVPDFKQPTGAHDAYKKGDKVIFKGKVFESLIDNNAYSPDAYPQGWKAL